MSHPADPAFHDLLTTLTSIQKSGVLVWEIEQHENDEEIVLMFRKHPEMMFVPNVRSLS